MKGIAIAAAAVVVLASVRTSADAPGDCADILNPTRDGALKMQGLADQLMKHMLDFQTRASLDGTDSVMQSVASALHLVRCS